MVSQDMFFIFPRRKLERQRRLQSAENVIGNLKCRFVLVHRHGTAKIRMGANGDAGDDRFDVAAMIQQRGQRGPAFFVHPIAFVKNANTAANHRRHQRRGVIGNLATFGQHRRDQQIFRAGIGRALIDEQFLLALIGSCHRQSRLANSWRSHQSGRQRQIAFINDDPTSEYLLQNFLLPDPGAGDVVGLGKLNLDPLNFPGFRHLSLFVPTFMKELRREAQVDPRPHGSTSYCVPGRRLQIGP